MEVYYKPSDIVWVKLDTLWWPGEVVEKSSAPEFLVEPLKKEPIAIVKFFDDDTHFHVVKTSEHIFPYNCERKNDFIKKGMDAFRAKNPKVVAFPKDVSCAEVKTGGNANILSDPIFSIQRKRNYAAEIFGSPSIKKPRESNKARAIKTDPIITHRRFLGYDDYEARVLILSPEDTSQEDPPIEESCKKFICPSCQFTAERLGILKKHTSCHVKDVSFTSRQPVKKPQKRKRRKALSDDDLSDNEKKNKTKRKYTKKADETLMADDEKSENDLSVSEKEGTKRKQRKQIIQPVIEEKKDVCTDIIADWDDESNHEDSNGDNTTLDSTVEGTQNKLDVARNDSSFVDSSFALNLTDEDLQSTKIIEVIEASEIDKPTEDKTIEKSLNKSCFDFDEDEEETKIPDAASGRKIPRVIPISERRKTFEFDDEPADNEEEIKKKILAESEELAKLTEHSNDDKETENLEKTYQSLMDSTENIDLPDVPNILKNEQNFHSAKTVKYPDKSKGESSDLIEAEVLHKTEKSEVTKETEKSEETEKVENSEKPEQVEKFEETEEAEKLKKTEKTEEISVLEKNVEKPEVVEDVTLEVDIKFPEKSQIMHCDASEEKELEEEEVKHTSKGKRKRKSRYTKRSRKSGRSKIEVTRSDTDDSSLKPSMETEDVEETKEPESAIIQVPLSILSPSKGEDTVKVSLSTEIEKLQEVNSKQNIQEKESNLSNAYETFDNDVVQSANIVAAEEVRIDEEKDKQEVRADIPEDAIIEEAEIVVEQSLEICEENISTEPIKPADEPSKIMIHPFETTTQIEKTELDLTEDTAATEKFSPEPKRRKTTRGFSRSSRSKPADEISKIMFDQIETPTEVAKTELNLTNDTTVVEKFSPEYKGRKITRGNSRSKSKPADETANILIEQIETPMGAAKNELNLTEDTTAVEDISLEFKSGKTTRGNSRSSRNKPADETSKILVETPIEFAETELNLTEDTTVAEGFLPESKSRKTIRGYSRSPKSEDHSSQGTRRGRSKDVEVLKSEGSTSKIMIDQNKSPTEVAETELNLTEDTISVEESLPASKTRKTTRGYSRSSQSKLAHETLKIMIDQIKTPTEVADKELGSTEDTTLVEESSLESKSTRSTRGCSRSSNSKPVDETSKTMIDEIETPTGVAGTELTLTEDKTVVEESPTESKSRKTTRAYSRSSKSTPTEETSKTMIDQIETATEVAETELNLTEDKTAVEEISTESKSHKTTRGYSRSSRSKPADEASKIMIDQTETLTEVAKTESNLIEDTTEFEESPSESKSRKTTGGHSRSKSKPADETSKTIIHEIETSTEVVETELNLTEDKTTVEELSSGSKSRKTSRRCSRSSKSKPSDATSKIIIDQNETPAKVARTELILTEDTKVVEEFSPESRSCKTTSEYSRSSKDTSADETSKIIIDKIDTPTEVAETEVNLTEGTTAVEELSLDSKSCKTTRYSRSTRSKPAEETSKKMIDQIETPTEVAEMDLNLTKDTTAVEEFLPESKSRKTRGSSRSSKSKSTIEASKIMVDQNETLTEIEKMESNLAENTTAIEEFSPESKSHKATRGYSRSVKSKPADETSKIMIEQKETVTEVAETELNLTEDIAAVEFSPESKSRKSTRGYFRSSKSKPADETTKIMIEQNETLIEVSKTELNLTEDKTLVEEFLSESKNRKSTRGYSRSSKSEERPSQGTRRGRSKDVEVSKSEESASSKSESTNQIDQQKSVSTRRSTRWDRKSLNEDKETPVEPIEEISPSYEEINNVIFGKAKIEETHNEESIFVIDSEQKLENDVKTLPKEEETKDSIPVSVPSKVPSIEENKVIEDVTEKESTLTDEVVAPEEKIDEPATDNKNQEQGSSNKIEKTLDELTVDHEKDRKSSHRSSRKEKRSSRSNKDSRKEDSGKTENISSHREDGSSHREDSSSHRSSRSGRRSSRQEKEKEDVIKEECSKTLRPDEFPTKRPKESSNLKKSCRSKDTHSHSIDVSINKNQEDETSRRSTKKDRKSSRTDQDSKKHKPSNERELGDRRDHSTSGHSSRRHSRSSKYDQDSSKSSKEKEFRVSSSPFKESEDNFSSNKEEKIEKPQSSSNKMEITLKEGIDPINALFSAPETVMKTREQKREELKSIFSFDYDEKEMKKRKTYSHKRKPKQIIPEKSMEPEAFQESTLGLASAKSTEVKELNCTEPEDKNVECKAKETVILSCPQDNKVVSEKEQNLFTSELEASQEISQELIEIEVPLIEKEELLNTPDEKDLIPTSEVSSTEIAQQTTEAKSEHEVEAIIETEIVFKNQNTETTEVPDVKTTELNLQDKIDHSSKDFKSDNNDSKIKEFQDLSNDSVSKKEATDKITKSVLKKPRKPSRWDQKEKNDIGSNQEQKTNQQDEEKNKEEGELKSLEAEPMKETIEENADSSQIALGMDETSQKEMNEIFSKKESSDLADNNAAQIELIFGSSPLPGLSENNIFIERNEKLETTDDKQELPHCSEEKKKDETVFDDVHNSSFEQENDLLESVESQVARITHYEEPKEDKSQDQRKVSIFDTPEKSEKPIVDSPEDKLNVDSISSTEMVTSKPEDSFSYKTEIATTSAPKTKKTYLLSEKVKRETEHKSPEKSSCIQDTPIAPKSAEKTNEVATKLTNPKKRFVKSFEDFELNKLKEKSLETEKPKTPEVKPGSSSLMVGKSPIAFKLKKQFLSKISNIFDEADEKKETKLLPKLKSAKNDAFILKKKEPLSVEKIGTDVTVGYEESILKTKTETEKSSEVADIVDEINVVSTEKKSEDSETSSADHLLLKEKLVLENSNNMCQKTDMSEETNLTKLEHSVSEVQFSAENSTSSSVDSIQSNTDENEASDELKPVAPAQSVAQNDDHIDVSKTEIITQNFPLDENKKEETEYVSIDGNLTVVSEKELAEGQVEITASMPSKKPMTLLNFSMDFSDDSSDASFEAFKKEKIQGITESLDRKNVEENKEKGQEIMENKEKQQTDGKEEKIVAKEKQDIDIEQKKQAIDKKEESQEIELNVTSDFEIENTSSSSETTKFAKNIDKTEAKKEEKEKIHDISLEDILKSSMPCGKEKENLSDIKDVDSDIFSILSEHVKITSKIASETVTVKSKGKSKSQLSITEDPPVVHEPVVIYNTVKSSTVTDMCDLEDHIPSQIVCTKNALINEEVMKVAGINNELTKEGTIQNPEPQMSKLLSRLTTDKKEDPVSKIKATEAEAKTKDLDMKSIKADPSVPKDLLKAAIKSKTMANTYIPYPPSKSLNKAIILSEKIIRPARETATSSSGGLKRNYEDVEDIQPYVITKAPRLELKKDETGSAGSQKILSSSISKAGVSSQKQLIFNPNKPTLSFKKSGGKAKILNQTIIRPASDSIQSKVLTEDNVDFDINSMPIVLSDGLLTPETIENIPIVLGEQAQKASSSENLKMVIDKKAQNNSKVTKTTTLTSVSSVNSSSVRMPIVKRTTPKILQTPKAAQKIIRQVTPTVSTKSAKFVVVSDGSNRPGQIIKKQTNLIRKAIPVTTVSASTSSNTSESTGHKIMIFTNQQGKQQRLLLTPAQQKLFGMQVAGKTVMKGATVAQKSQLAKVQQNSSLPSTSKLPGQSIQSSKLAKTTIGTSVATPQMKIIPPRKTQKVYTPGLHKPLQQKTILITNQHGQTVRKIQGTNEALLDKQVAEQLEAIKVSSMKAQQKQLEASARANITTKQFPVSTRKSIVKKTEFKQAVAAQIKPNPLTNTTISGSLRNTEQVVPALTPLKQDKKSEDILKQAIQTKPAQSKPERPLHQLVIQDNAGNQTTIIEGQILALPSETVDGQPQSYMLVTLDETGNLTPLNNEALMSLDPSLAGLAGGDLSNMVLQMDAGASKDNVGQTAQLQAVAPTMVQEKPKQEVQQPTAPSKPVEQVVAPQEQPAAQVQVTCNINGEPGQQIILTGDPVATQKFLDSLSDGSTDLANILAGAEGNSFLIQADGQQILINTEPTEAPLLQHNTSIGEQTEQGNPMFSSHPVKNQDILAAALADTDVFQQDQVSNPGKLTHSQLSPGQTLFPMNVGNVLETSLTLNSPIMTPLEVPSTNSKRIPDEEADILTHVPKNVDLPITITDPNISQTVSHQQVLMASDLQSNLELSLPISETNMSVTSGMNSPSFVYSLPSLDVSEHTELNQKAFSGSMPLLTEDIEESPAFTSRPSKIVGSLIRTESSVVNTKKIMEEEKHGIVESMSTRGMVTSDGTFMEEGLCTLGAEMCSSLSEPPPEMFDIPMETDGLNFLNKPQNESKEKSNPVDTALLMDDNSLEIPVQSQIVAELKDLSQSSDSSSSVSQDKTL